MQLKYRRDLYKIIDLSLPGAELGVASGEFSRDILEWGIAKLYLVDAWQSLNQKGDGGFSQAWHEDNFSKTKELMKKFGDRAVILRGLTYQMASHVEYNSLGFVNIDADHSYEGVTRDINAWWATIKRGGVMAFHDFQNPDYGVTEAVRDFFAPKGIQINILPEDKAADTGAYVIKP